MAQNTEHKAAFKQTFTVFLVIATYTAKGLN